MSEKGYKTPDAGRDELKELGESSLSTEQIFDGTMLKVYRDAVRLPDGGESVREYIRHPGAVAIIPVDSDGCVLLERQFRFPVNGVCTEIPAGKLNSREEDRLEAAKRELREETGAVASEWICLGDFVPAAAYCDERITLFLAQGLSFAGRDLDEDEFINIFRMPLSEVLAEVLDGKITDAKTQTGIMRAAFALGVTPEK